MSYKVTITLANNTDDDVVCVVPEGHIFENKKIGTGRQNVAAKREYPIIIHGNSSITVEIETECINQTYSPPRGPGNVSIYKIDRPFTSQHSLWQVMANPSI